MTVERISSYKLVNTKNDNDIQPRWLSSLMRPYHSAYFLAQIWSKKCTVPVVPTQEAIPEEGGYKKKMLSDPLHL